MSVRRAFLWSAIERFGQQAVQFGISIVLARLLSPAEYGLMGMLAIFFALANCFADAGLSSALIQRKNISNDDETSVFFLNVAAGLVLTLILCLMSPFVAAFYRQPALKLLLCVCSLQFFISSLSMVQSALLVREMDFRTLAIVSTVTTGLSGVIGIGMAWRGFGVWSLVGQGFMQACSNTLLIWRLRSWRPTGRFCWSSIRPLWPFSSRLLASGLLATVFEGMYSVVIGRLYKPAALGYFTRASGLANLPALSITGIITRVTFPTFSKTQDDKPHLKIIFRKTVRTLCGFHFPAMVGLAAVAGPLVKCLLTDKWTPCVPYLQLLAFCGLLYPLHALHLSILTSQGRSDLFFRLEVIKRVLTAIIIVATFHFGILAMVWGMLLHSVLCYALNAYYSRKIIAYTWTEQGKDILPFLTFSMVVGAAIWSLKALNFGSDWLLLLAQVFLGVMAFGLIAIAKRKSIYADAFTIGCDLCRGIGASLRT
jgi:O-antigen/teichoic acid export membrane protein